MSINIISWKTSCLVQRYCNDHLGWLLRKNPDIMCFQKTQATESEIRKTVTGFMDYYSYFSSSDLSPRFGGVATYSKIGALKVEKYFQENNYLDEGWILKLDFKDFVLINTYFPSISDSTNRIKEKKLLHKIKMYETFLNLTESLLKSGIKVLICGDFNIAHKHIDIAKSKKSNRQPGFLQFERALLDRLINQGYIDVFRIFNHEKGNYTFWGDKNDLREKDSGMRLDYFFVSPNLKNKITSAYILPDVVGSDHCPIGVELEF